MEKVCVYRGGLASIAFKLQKVVSSTYIAQSPKFAWPYEKILIANKAII